MLDLFHARAGRLIDLWYSRLVHRLGATPFFARGWGDLSVIDFEHTMQALGTWPPPHFNPNLDWKTIAQRSFQGTPYTLLQAEFRCGATTTTLSCTPATCNRTPCTGATYDGLPPESRVARARMLLPQLPGTPPLDCVVHLAGTGDHGFERRLTLGLPLLRHGIVSVALESPYYGRRRPAGQWGSKLHHVSDLLALGRATIEESLLLLHWAQEQGMARLGEEKLHSAAVAVLMYQSSYRGSFNHPPPGASGFSMGGVHAAMVASLFPGDLACAPLLAPCSAATAYCRGALRNATAWQPLAARQDHRQRAVEHAVQDAVAAMAAIQRGALLRKHGGDEVNHSAERGAGLPPSADRYEATTISSMFTRLHNEDTEEGRALSAAPPPSAADMKSLDQAHAAWRAAPGGALPLPGDADSWRQQQADVLAGAPAGHAEAWYWLEQVLEAYTDVTRYPRCV